MAGKFLLIEEAARQLGVSVDEVHRLVERKKLYPLRDGATLKFKIDEIERLSAEGADAGEPSGLGLELDLDDVAAGAPHESIAAATPLPSAPVAGPGQTVDLDLSGIGLADDSPTGGGGGSGVAPAGESIFGAGTAAQDDLAQTMLGTGEAFGLDAMDLDLDSIVGISSPSLAASASTPPVSLDKSAGKPTAGKPAGPADSGTLAIDLSGIGIGSQPSNAVGSNATGSLVLGSDVDPAVLSGPLTNAGAALSGALDSGLSLEDGDAAVSGIDIGMLEGGELDEDGATALAGDEFDLGDLDVDEDDGSVVAVEPESGDSSFFPIEASESSDFSGDMPADAVAAGTDLGEIDAVDVVRDTRFSVWQICGLVCCALLLMTGGFVMFDLMRTIGSPGELSLSSPLLNPLSSVFGWR